MNAKLTTIQAARLIEAASTRNLLVQGHVRTVDSLHSKRMIDAQGRITLRGLLAVERRMLRTQQAVAWARATVTAYGHTMAVVPGEADALRRAGIILAAQTAPTEGEPTDTWTVLGEGNVELTRVTAPTMTEARELARVLPEVQDTMTKCGGFWLRRLRTTELAAPARNPELVRCENADHGAPGGRHGELANCVHPHNAGR